MAVNELRPGEVRVWTSPTSDSGLPPLDEQLAVLSPAERGRADRLAGADHRSDYIHAHALLRRALSDCVDGVPPAAWEFAATPEGRPEVVDRGSHGDVRFSLSHTRGVVVCAVTVMNDCGVDVEPIGMLDALPRRRVLSAEEAAALGTAEVQVAAEMYTRLWTVKEAYAKARGLGLLLPFDQLHVTLGEHPAIDDRTPAATGDWHVEQWQPTDRHVAALAVAGAPRAVVHVTAAQS
ncbi:MAG: 4-phosphopantetheinyl transferase [Frankiales bacterium]|nr:4-phosphopantetheinyl transferase [Frankiales bacterium]